MCVSGNNGPACICQNGYPKDSRSTCMENTNIKIKFDTRKAGRRNESIRYQHGTLIGVIISVLICIVVASAYFYYQKIKPRFSKKNNLR